MYLSKSKKIGLVSALLCCSFVSQTHANTEFSDVATEDWFYTYVQQASEYKLFSGFPDGTFRPNATLTGQEFATVFSNLCYPEELAIQKIKYENQDWQLPYIETIKAYAQTDSVAHTMDFSQAITRVQVASLLYDAILAYELDSLTMQECYNVLNEQFVTISDISPYELAVGNVVHQGFLSGHANNTFGGTDTLTRLQGSVVATAMWNSGKMAQTVPALSNTGSSDTGSGSIKLGTATGNTAQNYTNSTNRWAKPDLQNIFVQGQEYLLVDATSGTVEITKYGSNHQKISQHSIQNPLESIGGFTLGSDGNFYVLYGKDNTQQSLTEEVFRVVKYNNNYQEIGRYSVLGSDCKTVYPFDAGSPSLEEENGTLVVHACREGFSGHQSQFTLVLDSSSMSLQNKLGEYQANHVSHSFNQEVKFDGNTIMLVDHGDAYPRAIVLHTSKDGGKTYQEKNILNIPGEIGANCTGVTLGGMEISSNHILTVINRNDWASISSFDSFNMHGLGQDKRDVVLLVTDKTSLSTKEITIASYLNGEKSASTPEIIPLTEDNFMILWEEYDINTKQAQGVSYVIVAGDGTNKTGITQVMDAQLSQYGSPVVWQDQVIWFVDKQAERSLYQLPVN